MPSFQCIHCRYGSLVRSNFRLTSDEQAYCKQEACELARQEAETVLRKHPAPFAKLTRGHARRQERAFVRIMQHSIEG